MRTRRLVAALLVVAAIGAVVSGANARPNAAKLTALKVAVYPSLDYAPLYVGLKLGLFKKHGIDINIQYVYTGTGLMAALTSGQVDVATNSVTAGANAIINGLPIKLLTATDFQAVKGNTEILVMKNSPIKSFGDLAGKTVATINLQGLFQLGTVAAVEKAGGDPNSVKAVPMSPTDEPNALAAGRLDAIVLQDPFLTTAKISNASLRSLGNPFGSLSYKILAGAFFTSDSAIQKEPAALKAFVAAWKEAADYAQTHPKLTRTIIPKYTGITTQAAQLITPPDYTSGAPANSLGPMLQQMKKLGWITATLPSYDQLVWTGK